MHDDEHDGAVGGAKNAFFMAFFFPSRFSSWYQRSMETAWKDKVKRRKLVLFVIVSFGPKQWSWSLSTKPSLSAIVHKPKYQPATPDARCTVHHDPNTLKHSIFQKLLKNIQSYSKKTFRVLSISITYKSIMIMKTWNKQSTRLTKLRHCFLYLVRQNVSNLVEVDDFSNPASSLFMNLHSSNSWQKLKQEKTKVNFKGIRL
jgi:hypothetical protein